MVHEAAQERRRRGEEAHANPEQLRAVCRDTLAEARRLGVPVPRLEAAEPYFADIAAEQ
ncbi:hypothetical protein [Actinoplanes sp. NPDC051494]|uniref:hypothetical protein n=1 Tax=Actinoplanes sp. NPDC051494 TaxID=3363907 RepID=UPI0037A3A13C